MEGEEDVRKISLTIFFTRPGKPSFMYVLIYSLENIYEIHFHVSAFSLMSQKYKTLPFLVEFTFQCDSEKR